MATLTELKESPEFQSLDKEGKRRAVTFWLQDVNRFGKERVDGFNTETLIDNFRPDLEEFGVLDKEDPELSLKTLGTGIALAVGNTMSRTIRDVSSGLAPIARKFGGEDAAKLLDRVNSAAQESRRIHEVDEIDRKRAEKPLVHPERLGLLLDQSLPVIVAGAVGGSAGTAVGNVPGGLLGSFTTMYPLLVTQGVNDLKKKGFDDDEAINRAMIKAVPEGMVELLPISRVLGRINPKFLFETVDKTMNAGWWPQLQRLLVDSATGAFEESTQEFINIAAEAPDLQSFINTVRDNEKLFEVAKRMAEAGLGGALLQPIIGGGVEIAVGGNLKFADEVINESVDLQPQQEIDAPNNVEPDSPQIELASEQESLGDVDAEVVDTPKVEEKSLEPLKQLNPEINNAVVEERTSIDDIRESISQKEKDIVRSRSTGSVVFTGENTVKEDLGNNIAAEDVKGEKKQRKFPKRLATLPRFQKEADAINKNARNFYTPQSLEEISNVLAQQSDESIESEVKAFKDFVGEDGFENRAVLALGELINRKHAAGEDVKGLIEFGGRAGTFFGQLIRQFAEINNANPRALLNTIEEFNKKKGGRDLTDKQRKKLEGLIKEDINLRQKVKSKGRFYREGLNASQAKELSELIKKSEKASSDLISEYTRLAPKSGAELIEQLIQGNLLVPISFGINLTSNVSMLFIRNGTQSIAAAGDSLFSLLTGNERSRAFPNLKDQAIGFGVGLRKGGLSLLAGKRFIDPAGEVDIRGFHPLDALAQAWKGSAQIINDIKNSNLSIKEKSSRISSEINRTMKFLIEGTFGIPAEFNFRMLSLGDLPFRESARRDLLSQQASLRNLSDTEKKNFINMPTKEVEDIVTQETLESVFQQQNPLNDTIQFFFRKVRNIPVLGEWVQALVVRPIIPYSMTPTNLVHETLQLVAPWYSFLRGLSFAGMSLKESGQEAKNLRAKAEISFAKVLMGQSMLIVANMLSQAGLISGDPEKDKKRRDIQWNTLPPNRINISGLKRLMKGGDPSLREGDEVRSVFSFGFFGIISNFVANEKARSLDPKVPKFNLPIVGSIPAIADVMMDLTVMKGTGDLLNAIHSGNYEKWFQNYFRVITAVAMPNTFAALNRSKNDFIRDVRPTNIQEAFLNAVNEKNPTFDPSGQPFRRDLLGRKIRRTPEGSSPLVYHVFDVSKKSFVPRDKFVFEMLDVFEKNGLDNRALPSTPSRSINLERASRREGLLKTGVVERLNKNGFLELNNEEYDKRQELVGIERRNRMLTLFSSNRYQDMNDSQKMRSLMKAYSMGSKVGTAKFKRSLFKNRGGRDE